MRRDRARRTGFTLIEVLLVTAILVFLGTVAVVGYSRIKAGQDKKSAKLMVDQVASAVKIFQTQMNRLPTADKGLTELITAPDDDAQKKLWVDGGGPFLENSVIPKDPWGQEIKYKFIDASGDTPQSFQVYSTGPDMQDGTDDDIKSTPDDTTTAK